MTTDAAFADALSGAAPAVLREVGPPESPWPGLLVTDGDEVGVLVDADVVAASFPYWDDRDGHVAVPRDVLASADRVRALMPACPVSLESLLRRWERDPPSLGQLVTAAVSVIRGAEQHRGDGLTGSWWLRADGRPLFAAGSGTTTLPVASSAALRAMSAVAGTGDASALLLAIAQDLSGDMPTIARAAEWEAALFALAPASAVIIEPRAGGDPARRPVMPVTRAGRRAELAIPAPRMGGRLADRMAAVLEHIRQRSPQRIRGKWRGRRAVILVAGAAVLVAGMLWPAPDSPEPTPPAPLASPDAGVATTPETSAPAGRTPESGVEVARALLRGLQECADAACRASLWEGGDAVPPFELPDADGSTIDLVDDLGGVMVLRVHPPGGVPDQILVIVEVDDGQWRLRDARPLAPPS